MTNDTDKPTKESKAIKDAIKNEREKCILEIEQFARDYVAKWQSIQEEGVGVEGWAILQAAEHLRDMGKK